MTAGTVSGGVELELLHIWGLAQRLRLLSSALARWGERHALTQQVKRSLMVMPPVQMDDFARAHFETLQLRYRVRMIGKEIEVGRLVARQVDLTRVNAIVEPLLGNPEALGYL
jgi:hypothetical protein